MRQILLYGLILGALLFLIQYAQYRLVFVQHAESAYTGVIAAICCAAGIWAGVVLTRRYQRKSNARLLAAIHNHPPVQAESSLTPRELEVLQLIAQGLSNQEIAGHLFLSLNTVKTHVSNVFAKLDVQRRTQAIQKAKQLGLLA